MLKVELRTLLQAASTFTVTRIVSGSNPTGSILRSFGFTVLRSYDYLCDGTIAAAMQTWSRLDLVTAQSVAYHQKHSLEEGLDGRYVLA
jgi:hypothetical protein